MPTHFWLAFGKNPLPGSGCCPSKTGSSICQARAGLNHHRTSHSLDDIAAVRETAQAQSRCQLFCHQHHFLPFLGQSTQVKDNARKYDRSYSHECRSFKIIWQCFESHVYSTNVYDCMTSIAEQLVSHHLRASVSLCGMLPHKTCYRCLTDWQVPIYEQRQATSAQNARHQWYRH